MGLQPYLEHLRSCLELRAVPESRALLGNAGADDVARADPLGIADSASARPDRSLTTTPLYSTSVIK